MPDNNHVATPDDVAEQIRDRIKVCRHDIARAKHYILKMTNGNVVENATKWLAEQKIEVPRVIKLEEADLDSFIDSAAQAIGLKQAFFQAAIELSSNGSIAVLGDIKQNPVSIDCHTRGYSSGLPSVFTYTFPERIVVLTAVDDISLDVDVFLEGVDCVHLHEGIHEAVNSSLDCFHRGLFMPAIVMLAASAEAAWTECGYAVATILQDKTLEDIFNNQYSSISKKVVEIRKSLESPSAKSLLKRAGQSIGNVVDAEVWTTVLRDRRNALHWSKAKNFIASHSETAVLLMAAPMHLKTLESIRLSCC